MTPNETKRLIPAALVALILLGSGYVRGVWSFRWSAARELRAASARLESIPRSFGDWEAIETPLDEREAQRGRIAASASRRYTNRRDGRVVAVLIVCGRPGPIAAHTPEVCYAGSGYEIAGDPTKVAVAYGAPRPAEFRSIRVSKPDPARPERMRIDYAWFSDDAWSAPDGEARLRFAGRPVLYKLYAIREETRPDGRSDPGPAFLGEFLPLLQHSLSGAVISTPDPRLDHPDSSIRLPS